MLKDIKHTIRQSAIYGVSRVAAKGISFILIPLYTSYFSAEAIGNINLLESFWQYLYTICLFSVETAIIRFCGEIKDSTREQQILFIFFIILIFNSLTFTVLGYFFSNHISIFIFKDSSLSIAVLYCFLISAFESLLVIPLTISRIQNKPGLYTTLSVLNLFINLFLQLFFILYLKGSVDYIFLSKFVAPGTVFILMLYFIVKNIKPYFSIVLLKDIFKFSFPLMAATLLAMLLNTVDRYILAGYVTKDDVGIYTIGYSIGSVANFFIVSPFVLAFNVIGIKKYKDGDSSRFFTKSATYLYFVMIFISLIFSLFTPELIKLVIKDPLLWSSENIIRIILFSNCLASLYYINIQSFYFKKRTDLIFTIFAFCLVFNIVSNFLLIQYYGIYASAVLSVLSYLLLVIISYNTAKKHFYIKFENYKLILLSLLFILFSSVPPILKIESFIIDLTVKISIILIFPLTLYSLKFFEEIEIVRIKGFINKYIYKIKY